MYNMIDKVSLLCVGVFEASKGFNKRLTPFNFQPLFTYIENKRRRFCENKF